MLVRSSISRRRDVILCLVVMVSCGSPKLRPRNLMGSDVKGICWPAMCKWGSTSLETDALSARLWHFGTLDQQSQLSTRWSSCWQVVGKMLENSL